MAMPHCSYLAKGAKRPSHTTNTIKFDRIPVDPSNSNKRFDLGPFDQKNSTYLQPPAQLQLATLLDPLQLQLHRFAINCNPCFDLLPPTQRGRTGAKT